MRLLASLRNRARHDIARLYPTEKFKAKGGDIQSDFEVSWFMLSNPATLELTRRELVAAQFLCDASMYLRAKDDFERGARRRLTRSAGHRYARMINDKKMIDAFA